ncbi:hypothetical protein QQ73_12985 [Candidatus Endoriftia persephone str. Guaymas]|nr:hypothetical protein [Candidatus Endoriftia persephone str. Guaymas]
MQNMMLKILAVLALCLLIAGHATAEIFKWTDRNGKVHFSDKKPRHLEAKKIKLKINTYEAVSLMSN